jgi:hypothetical protein
MLRLTNRSIWNIALWGSHCSTKIASITSSQLYLIQLV